MLLFVQIHEKLVKALRFYGFAQFFVQMFTKSELEKVP